MKVKKTINIRELADKYDISIRTLRYYDQINLLKPSDKTTVGRLYDIHDELLLQRIISLKKIGFTLQEIKKILSNDRASMPIVFTYDRLENLKQKRDEIDSQINLLEKVVLEIRDMKNIDFFQFSTMLNMIEKGEKGYQYLKYFANTNVGSKKYELSKEEYEEIISNYFFIRNKIIQLNKKECEHLLKEAIQEFILFTAECSKGNLHMLADLSVQYQHDYPNQTELDKEFNAIFQKYLIDVDNIKDI